MGKSLIKISTLLVVLALCAVAGCEPLESKKKPSETGLIDRDVIMKLSAFQRANDSLTQKVMELDKKYAGMAKGLRPDQQEELYLRYRQDVETLKAQEMKPLMDKAQAAVALVAKEKKMKVVLDSKIVIAGADDITEDVKEKFKSSEKLTAPEEAVGSDSKIGYFDQEVVRSLKMFRDADQQVYSMFSTMKKELETKMKTMSDEEKQKVFSQYDSQLESKKNELYSPLLKKVTGTVETVAKNKGLVLVLDKQFVMFGGKNVTDEVVEALKGK
ncbi:MAG: OmpH family outer membrane protein [Candidatus Eremiobacteraeota bacterium]|nr:OmpH family outer membrane protein [Candidatus Eremiobacteraeota bacterium]